MKERYLQQRLIPAAMEPRGVAVVPQPHGGEVTVWSATQIPHILKIMLTATTGMPEHKLRVIAPAVGGGFGSKLDVYAEELIALAVARQLSVPVRWTESRSENAHATIQGRGQIQDIELAADADGKVTAVRVHLLADMGAYLQLVTPGIPLLGAFLYHGVYDIPDYSFTCTSVFTNKTPTDAYRGAGRPEATYAIERAMDALARKVGVGPDEIRRRNFIPTEAFPYSSAAGLVFDSGDYAPNLARGPRAGALGRAQGRAGRAAAPRATPWSSASASPPTSRCAGWPRAGCWRRSATAPAAGRRPPCGCCPPARCRSSPAPRPTGRATRPPGRCSWPTSSA